MSAFSASSPTPPRFAIWVAAVSNLVIQPGIDFSFDPADRTASKLNRFWKFILRDAKID
jgi:hypothetical protein